MKEIFLLEKKGVVEVEKTRFIVNLFYDEEKESVLEKVRRLLKEEIQHEYKL